ncbi:MAG: hypothetical protein ABSB42_16810 [Tepidisphaeraceae bacterium]
MISRSFALFVDILQYLVATRRFSKTAQLRRFMGYLQMRYREGAKDAKLREEKTRFDLTSRNFASFAPSR